MIETRSEITCPSCGHRTGESMPEDACQVRYTCARCSHEMSPKAGDCCVFCSYGTNPCPPIQAERAGIATGGSCCSSASAAT